MSDPCGRLTLRSKKGIKVFAHHLEKYHSYCVCGSAWNFYEKGCSSLYPIVNVASNDNPWADHEVDDTYFECFHGHAFCGRH